LPYGHSCDGQDLGRAASQGPYYLASQQLNGWEHGFNGQPGLFCAWSTPSGATPAAFWTTVSATICCYPAI